MDLTEEEKQPITERSNPLSRNIDLASPEEIVTILYTCDQELFSGWGGSKGMYDPQMIVKIKSLADKMAEIMKVPTGSVVLSGCGTSGRLAFLTVQTINRHLKSLGRRPCFQYLIAGGDQAIFQSVELAEDDPHLGARSLKEVTDGHSAVVFIGITCGLSAPYVAGQLELCLAETGRFTPVLIGFNQLHQARNVAVKNWNKTFLQVAVELESAEKSDQACILNPIIGPDPITGSSRMKSGTATRILLDVLSLTAIWDYPQPTIPEIVAMYEAVCHQIYQRVEDLASLIRLAGNSLLKKGHIYYLGRDAVGLTAIVDATECVPTFGASFHDIRGFIEGGFRLIDNKEGDLSNQGPQFRISINAFVEEILPHLKPEDLVVFLGSNIASHYQAKLSGSCCRKAAVLVTINEAEAAPCVDGLDVTVRRQLDLPALEKLQPDLARSLLGDMLLETGVKWLVNALSTGAHVLAGKVYQNKMIDVRVSNSKLFHRAVGIIQKYSQSSQGQATTCLLKSIYDTDQLSEAQMSASTESHILAARQSNKVVPVALLLASLGCRLEEAKNMLDQQPIISRLFRQQPHHLP